ncbi:MAG: hypothetical protein HC824_16120 [Synechococcales cyanobacterium RM1_1_8]|nr:hypothetical protein [Synechococcales cyanobacterium RM1_1_8]
MAAPPSASELLLRPRDITAVLDSLTSRAQTDPKLAQLDLNRVGIVGQSLGGYTALAAAGAELNRPLLAQRCPEDINRFTLNISLPLQCRLLDLPVQTSFQVKDPRIGAVLAINPLTSQIFGPSGLAKLEVPVMFVAGTHDYFAPALPEQLQPFGWLKTTHKYLLLADNSTHFSFLGDTGTSGLLPTSQRLLGPDGHPAQQALQALGLAFFDRHLEAIANTASTSTKPT